MHSVEVYVVAQLSLAFGLAGLFWPDKLLTLFDVLMFPWPASYRAIRTHGIVSILGYLVVLGKLILLSR